MQLPRNPLALSLLVLAPLAGACTLPGKVCIGDCGDDMSAADAGQSQTGSPESGGATDPDPTATTAVGEETGAPMAVSCDNPDTMAPFGPGCGDGTSVAGEFCLSTVGSVSGLEPIVSSVHGRLDPGGEHLITSAPSDILTAFLDGPGPFIDLSTKTYDPMLGGSPLELTDVGDFNEDGKLDVVGRLRGVDVDDSDAIIVFRGGDDGGFENAQIIPYQQKILYGPAVADWNEDDHLDLVIVSNGAQTLDEVEIRHGDGSGGFVPSLAFSDTFDVDAPLTMGALGPTKAADDFVSFDVEGRLNIHIQSPGDTFVSVFLGPQMVIHAIQIADLDDDGDGDIVVLGHDTSVDVTMLAVLLQDVVLDEPKFAVQYYGVDCGATTLAIGRIDGDTVPDIVVGSPDSNMLMIRRNNGGGAFWASTHAIFEAGIDQLHAFDLSGDGLAEIVGASSITGMMAHVLNEP